MKSLIAEQTPRFPARNQRSVPFAPCAGLIMIIGSLNLLADKPVASGQWNIMVVPARQTIYSGRVRELFDKRCAGCHSKDGRAQTPVARQRHVRDLSESKLSEAAIIEQITRGTHDKVVDFKMPSFSNVFSRLEIESLVPVVKAFRPYSSEADDTTPNPRLVGIVNFPHRKSAVLEKVAGSGRYFILSVNESHSGVQLAKIMPAKSAVRVWITGQPSPITLTLDSKLSELAKQKRSGFLYRLLHSVSDDYYGLTLDDATIDLALFFYAQFTGRTLLRSPHLPTAKFDLATAATSAAQLNIDLKKALAEQGITVIPDREKFLLVVPSSMATLDMPRSSSLKTPPVTTSGAEQFPGGVIVNLPSPPLSDAVELYLRLTGRQADHVSSLPASGVVNFTTQTALSEAECAYALETLLELHRTKVMTTGDDRIRLEVISKVSP